MSNISRVNHMLDTTSFLSRAVLSRSYLIGSYVRHYVPPLLPRAMVGSILPARSPPGAVPSHMTDGGFQLKPLAPVASQHTAVPPTWLVQQCAETLLEPRAWVRSPHQSCG